MKDKFRTLLGCGRWELCGDVRMGLVWCREEFVSRWDFKGFSNEIVSWLGEKGKEWVLSWNLESWGGLGAILFEKIGAIELEVWLSFKFIRSA